MAEKAQMFFIIGRGRSGTDLLANLLNAHENLFVANEAMFIMILFRKYRKRIIRKKEVGKFVDDLWEEERIEDWWSLDKQILIRRLRDIAPVDFPGACREVIRLQSAEDGKQRVKWLGDKNPTYALYLKQLKKVYPDARFIFIVRDHRDNIRSFQKVSFDLNSTAALAERWKKYNSEILGFHRDHRDSTILVRFEDLLKAPEQELKKLCQFFAIDYRASMLEFYKKDKNLDDWQENLKKPIDPSKVDKWKKEMPENEVRIADSICYEVAEELGYEVKPEKFGLSILFATFIQRMKGRLSNRLEAGLYLLPHRVSSVILKLYRMKTKTKTQK